jgi:quercetin dioxygenase-like cupin family protein
MNGKEAGMTRKRLAAIAGISATAIFILVLAGVPAAGGSQPPAPITAEPLTGRAHFADTTRMRIKVLRDGTREVVRVRHPSRTVTVRFVVQPGAQFPWHSHRGPVVVNVVSGEFTYVDEQHCAGIRYPAGTAFFDLGKGHVHTAFNGGDEPTVLVATFFRAPTEGELFIPAEPGCP